MQQDMNKEQFPMYKYSAINIKRFDLFVKI